MNSRRHGSSRSLPRSPCTVTTSWLGAFALQARQVCTEQHSHSLVGVNELYGGHDEFLKMLGNPRQKVLLDSGVFWLANTHATRHGLSLPDALAIAPEDLDGFEKLRDAFVRVAREYEDQLWGVVELDQGGADNKRRTRRWLESEGLRVIPVYHPLNDGWDFLDELLDDGYDRLMIGNVVQVPADVRDRIILTVWERIRRRPADERPWLHLLGLGPYPTLCALPCNSVDTSNHVQSMRYGSIIPGGMAMGPFSRLNGYLYEVDAADPDRNGLHAYGRLIGFLADGDERAFRTQHADLDRLFQTGLFPDVVPGEREPVKEAA